jgi:hypothetical protein
MLCCHVLLPCYVILGLSLCSVVFSLVVMCVLSYIYIYIFFLFNPRPPVPAGGFLPELLVKRNLNIYFIDLFIVNYLKTYIYICCS